MKFLFAIAFLSFALLSQAGEKRQWTSSDGKNSFEGELIEFTAAEVKIKRATDFQIFKMGLDRLSTADQTFVRGLLRERARDTGLKEGPYAQKITGEFVPTKSKQGLNYQVFGNPKLDGKERYPLVIWLHGSGQSGDDNKSQMGGATKVFTSEANQAERPCFMIAPQCPDANIGWKDGVAMNLVALIADMCDYLPIDESRIYLTGSSMGGSGSWYLAAKFPKIFAAVVPLCGGGDPKNAEVLKGIPIWCFHGDKDDMVPVERSRTMFAAIKAVGGEKMKYSELAGEGHGITGVVYPKADLHEWIFAQRLVKE
ncbi:MAG: dienelactone hydrolase family protein [Verrucomicrobiaceae bacterium]|nr:dienelactone hydrolase family protein [Verrucomicrobiaceae bacterium]